MESINSTTIIIAVCVSLCGPIAFVGIIIPHWVRMTLKHKSLELLTSDIFIAGGLFLALCEFIAQTLLMDYHVPVGVVTSLLGAPFFIYALLRLNFR